MSDDRGQGDAAAVANDLARISGIGSKTAGALCAAGIRTYTGLASASADDILNAVRSVAHPSTDQVASWRSQARELAGAASAAPAQAEPETPAEPPDNGQREESFMIRVLVNEDGSIRRMTAQQVGKGSREEAHWPTLERGAQRDALFGFIEMAISAPAADAKTSPERPSGQALGAVAAPGAVPPRPVEPPHPAEPRPAAAPPHPTEPRRAPLASSAVLSVEPTALRPAEPFTMTMTLDLTGPASHADRLGYSAIIVARPLAGGPKQTVAQTDGLLAAASPAISMKAAGLPAGTYRLDGAVSLREPGSDQPVDLAALTEGLLVQVLPG